MFWVILPMLVSGEKDVSWNLFFGSFLGVVAITFVVSMKGAFVSFKSSFFQYNCCNKPPHLQVEYQCQSCISFVNNFLACLQAVTGGFIAENPFRLVIERHLGFLRRALPDLAARIQDGDLITNSGFFLTIQPPACRLVIF